MRAVSAAFIAAVCLVLAACGSQAVPDRPNAATRAPSRTSQEVGQDRADGLIAAAEACATRTATSAADRAADPKLIDYEPFADGQLGIVSFVRGDFPDQVQVTATLHASPDAAAAASAQDQAEFSRSLREELPDSAAVRAAGRGVSGSWSFVAWSSRPIRQDDADLVATCTSKAPLRLVALAVDPGDDPAVDAQRALPCLRQHAGEASFDSQVVPGVPQSNAAQAETDLPQYVASADYDQGPLQDGSVRGRPGRALRILLYQSAAVAQEVAGRTKPEGLDLGDGPTSTDGRLGYEGAQAPGAVENAVVIDAGWDDTSWIPACLQQGRR